MRRDMLLEGKERDAAVTALYGPVDVLLAELQASRGGLTADERAGGSARSARTSLRARRGRLVSFKSSCSWQIRWSSPC